MRTFAVIICGCLLSTNEAAANTNPFQKFEFSTKNVSYLDMAWHGVDWYQTSVNETHNNVTYSQWKRIINLEGVVRVCSAAVTSQDKFHFGFNQGLAEKINPKKPKYSLTVDLISKTEESDEGIVDASFESESLAVVDWEHFQIVCGLPPDLQGFFE